jgi:2-polyprenyl-3-methyl-5-hydroxy-6-metoxy-1,4-benzoquinol methylase
MTAADDKSKHWNQVYSTKLESGVSWYSPHLELSLELISNSGITKDASIIDVGGGASTLVDDLYADGYADLSVLDLSMAALELAKERMGANAEHVNWIAGDITKIGLERQKYDLWHDRAVFHFLTEPEQRKRYVEQVAHAVRDGGTVIIATFGTKGPEQCSSLPIVRYSDDQLHSEFGASFDLVNSTIEMHETPWGAEQEFVYCCCRKQSTEA